MSSRQVPSDLRSKVLDRDDHECQFCEMGSEEHMERNGGDLHVHHIVPQRSNGDHLSQNLITVCQDCHSTLEHTQANGIEQLHDELVGSADVVPSEEAENREQAAYRAGWREKVLKGKTEKVCKRVYAISSGIMGNSVEGVYTDREMALDRVDEMDKHFDMRSWNVSFWKEDRDE